MVIRVFLDFSEKAVISLNFWHYLCAELWEITGGKLGSGSRRLVNRNCPPRLQ